MKISELLVGIAIVIIAYVSIDYIICNSNYNYGIFNNAKTFVYKKHFYITFYSGQRAGVVHDPDCKYCLEKFD